MSTPGASHSSPRTPEATERRNPQTRTPDKRSISVDGQTLETDDYQSLVEQLRREQHDMKNARKRLARELRNAQRRTQRIRQKACQLSTQDLLQVLMLRRQSADKRDAREAMEAESTVKKPRLDAAAILEREEVASEGQAQNACDMTHCDLRQCARTDFMSPRPLCPV